MLDDHGDAIEADLARFYHLDIGEFYRGELSPRRLAVLIRYLPHDSALVTALNDGKPVWASAEHLLADLWAVLVRVNSDPAKISDTFDHPIRAAATAKVQAAEKAKLKEMFLSRKGQYTHQGGDL